LTWNTPKNPIAKLSTIKIQVSTLVNLKNMLHSIIV